MGSYLDEHGHSPSKVSNLIALLGQVVRVDLKDDIIGRDLIPSLFEPSPDLAILHIWRQLGQSDKYDLLLQGCCRVCFIE